MQMAPRPRRAEHRRHRAEPGRSSLASCERALPRPRKPRLHQTPPECAQRCAQVCTQGEAGGHRVYTPFPFPRPICAHRKVHSGKTPRGQRTESGTQSVASPGKLPHCLGYGGQSMATLVHSASSGLSCSKQYFQLLNPPESKGLKVINKQDRCPATGNLSLKCSLKMPKEIKAVTGGRG